MDLDYLPKWMQQMPFGADNENDSGTGDSGEGDQNEGNNDAGNSGAGNSGENDNADDPYAGLTTRELKRLLSDSTATVSSVTAERDTLKTKVDESEREKLDEKGKLELDLSNERDANAKLKSTNAKLAIINAILMDESYQWHNPEMVAAQLNSEVVKVSDDGKVEGLKNELKRIAKDNDWMLKKQEQQQNNGNGTTGLQPGQGGSNNGNNGGQPNVADLAKVMPALASRIPR